MNNYNFHLNVKIISGTKGRACAAAAYQSGEKVKVDNGAVKSYGKLKAERVISKGIELPNGASSKFKDRSYLWNAVEEREQSRYARRFKMSLPDNLNIAQQEQLVREFIQNNITDKGLIADWAIHCDKEGHNPHAHILTTTRPLDKSGHWLKAKKRQEYVIDKVNGIADKGYKVPGLDAEGNQKYRLRERDGRTWKEYEWQRKTVESCPADSKQYLLDCRKAWADLVNQQQQKIGSSYRWSEKSYKARGIDLEPTLHEGHGHRSEERKRVNEKIRDLRSLIIRQNALAEKIEQLYKIRADENRQHLLEQAVQRYIDSPLPFNTDHENKSGTEHKGKSYTPIWSLSADEQFLFVCKQEKLWSDIEDELDRFLQEQQDKEFSYFEKTVICKAVEKSKSKINADFDQLEKDLQQKAQELKELDKKIASTHEAIEKTSGFFDSFLGKSEERKTLEKQLLELHNTQKEQLSRYSELKRRSEKRSERLLSAEKGIYTRMKENFVYSFKKRYSELLKTMNDVRTTKEAFKRLAEEHHMRVFNQSENELLMQRLGTSSAAYMQQHFRSIRESRRTGQRVRIRRALEKTQRNDKIISRISKASQNSQALSGCLFKNGQPLAIALAKLSKEPAWSAMAAYIVSDNRSKDWKFLSELEKEELMQESAER